jgi:alkanesulfonate monooxygenase SsuD/methylene tetrahydromethanopterin reductase-like flavin-dependent oxidoreductase (luciferase family)
MKIGYAATFQNPYKKYSDSEVYQGELRLAKLGASLGFTGAWTVEHHFTGYQMVPDAAMFLAHMSGANPALEVGTMCIVVPWHDPVRVAEQAIMLDHYTQGKVTLGLARGAGTVEFDGFGRDMGSSRGMFIEACTMISNALNTGVAEYDGQYVKQARVELRPGLYKPFAGRIYVGSVSPESFEVMARLGVGVLITPAKPWEVVAEEMRTYRLKFQEYHHARPAPTIAVGWVACHEDPDRAREMANQYVKGYWKTVLQHYKFNDPANFKGRKGYEFYQKGAEIQAQMSEEAIAEDFMKYHIWGTPEQCFEKIMAVREQIGCTGYNLVFRYADMPFEESERSLRLFSSKVLPELLKVPDPAALVEAA